MVAWALPLIHTVTPVATKFAASTAEGWVVPWRVAYETRKQAKQAAIPAPDYATLRKYLGRQTALKAFRVADPALYEQGREELTVLCLRSQKEPTARESERLVAFLLAAYIRILSGGKSVEVAVQNVILQLTSDAAQREESRFAGDITFEANLNQLPPRRASEAKELVSEWPALRRLTLELVKADEPRTAIVSWFGDRPSWFQSPPSAALLWFARLSLDYGANDVAVATLDDAIAAGATPADHLRVLRAVIQAGNDPELRKSLLRSYVDHDPLARALTFSDDGDYTMALAELHAWQPTAPMDRELKATIVSQLTATDDLDEAIRIAQEGATLFGSVDCALFCADYLLLRGSARQTPIDFADLEQSLRLALDTRQSIRQWRGPSNSAAVRAMSAAQALGNVEEAWRISQCPPVGDATAKEADDRSVRGQAAIVAAQLGKRSDAERLLADLDDEQIQSEVAAIFASLDGDEGRALENWTSVAAHSQRPQDLLRACQHIAFHGVRSDELPRLVSTHPELAEEIALIADAFTNRPQAVATLKTRARTSRMCAYALLEWHTRQDEILAAAQLAERSGSTWSDAIFDLLAARFYLQLRNYEAAHDKAREALRVAGSGWAKRLEAYDIIIQSLSIQRRWDRTAEAAAELLALDQENQSAAWVLTIAQFYLCQFDDAWRTYTQIAHRPDPRFEQEAVVRVQLWHRFERNADNLDTLFDLIDRFQQSEDVRHAAAAALIQFPVEEGDERTPQRIQERLMALITSLNDRFVLQNIPQDDPMAALNALLAGVPDATDLDREISERISEGRLPLGFGAAIHGRIYADILAAHTDAALFSGDATTFESEVALVRQAITTPVVVDITALLALSTLDPSTSEQLLGVVSDLRASRAQRVDAVVAVESLSRRPTMTVGRSAAGAPQVSTITEEEADRRLRRAETLNAMFDKVAVCSDPPSCDPVPAWQRGLEFAKSEKIYFWCDDAIIRELGRQDGVSSFSTQALIEGLRLEGAFDAGLAMHCQAALISNYYVGNEFRHDWAAAAAELDAWKPRGAAAHIAFGPTSESPDRVISFVIRAIERNLDDPEAMSGWVAVASKWFIRIAGSARAGQSNLTILLLQILRQPWLGSNQLPFILQGMRIPMSKTEISDPFESAMGTYYGALVRAAGHRTAIAQIGALVALADPRDRTTAYKVALLFPGLG